MVLSTMRSACFRHGRRVSSNIRRCIHTGKIEDVKRGMQRWVDELVVAENLCPFAAKSSYKFEVYPEECFSENTILFFRRCVEETIENKANLRNTFVIFPFLRELQGMDESNTHYKGAALLFRHFYQAVIQECGGLALTPEMEITGEYSDPEKCVVAMQFHPDFPRHSMQDIYRDPLSETLPSPFSEERFYSESAPFPAIHLLPLDDLLAARGKNRTVLASTLHFSVIRPPPTTLAISKRNELTLPRIGLRALQKRMKDYQSEVQLWGAQEEGVVSNSSSVDDTRSVLQVVEMPPPERLQELEQRGIRVEVLKTTDIKPVQAKATTTTSPIKKKNKKKGKNKRK